ncbi:signal peptidase I [Cnuibacter sp. UC19_7]|uniref:signal peptidase I n=1 Tax=Cnuibacter sp. UC19_7 TaxID=3350166 RepID=UPI00366CA42A
MHAITTAAPRRGPVHHARTRGAAHRAAPVARTGTAKDAVLTVLGLVGIVSVLWLIAAWALHLSVIVFVTGSMTPTLPTGAAAIVQEVGASELRVGDIVTVLKPDSGIPVTHRIVDLALVDGSPDSRALTLKGDANDIVDPVTYTVTDAQRVIAGAPGLGWLVIGVKSPAAMVAITLVIALAIAWALWPSRQRTET